VAILPQPNNTAQPLNQKTQDFSLKGGPVKSADSAVALVIQDTQRAEKFIMARLWMSEWRVAKALYEAPIKQDYWRDTFVPRSSNSFPLVSQHVRAILDQAILALFPAITPFGMQPETGTPRQVARGWESVISYQLRQAGAKQQLRLIMKDAEIFGTGLGKWGWETFERQRTLVKRAAQPLEIASPIPGGPPTFIDTKESDELVEYDVTETVSQPYIQRVEINHLLVSPDLRSPDVRDAEYVVHRHYPTLKKLSELRGYMGYNIPSDEELMKLAMNPEETADSSALEAEGIAFPTQGHRPLPRYLDASQDPTLHKLEVLEYWTKDKVIVVLQRKVAIRNEANPFGVIPFVSCYWDDIPGTFYSLGIPRRIGGTQTHVQGLRNLRLDDIHMNLQNMWKCKKGSNISAQPIKQYPGAIFKVDDMSNLEALEKQPVLPEAYKEEEVLIADAEKTSGANSILVQGGTGGVGQSTGMRSASGANAVGAASSARIQGFVNVVADQVLIPILYSFLKMDRLWLAPDKIRKIVGKTIWQSMEQDHDGDLLVDMCNESDIEFKMLAGSNIAAKQKQAQQLPLLIELFSQPAVGQGINSAGFKINWLELGRRAEQSSDWDSQEDIFIPLTDEDKQKQAASNPKVLDVKATQARLAQMHSNASQLSAQEHGQKIQQIQEQGLTKSGETVLTKSIERSMEKDQVPQLAGEFGG
jgi:hypothetical protein